MKFFTRSFTDGDLTDEQADAVVPAYWRYLETLSLPQSVRDLGNLNPHDAYIFDVEHKPLSHALLLRLRCGDLQVGYFDALLSFSGVTILPADLTNLFEAIPPEIEILYDEVDRIDANTFEYRLLLWPIGEIAFQFRGITIVRQACRTGDAIFIILADKRILFDITTIPMDQFPLGWRLTDPKYRVLPPAHLEQIQPLDAASAKRLLDMAAPWYGEQPFTQGYFADITSTSIEAHDAQNLRRVRKWLYQRGVPFKQRVFLSWSHTEAAMTTWKMVVKYWNDFWYPGSDDLVVFDESLSWALFLWHEEEAFFASRPMLKA